MLKKIKGKFEPTTLLEKYPQLVPVVIKKNPRSTLRDLPKNKFLLKTTNIIGDIYKMLREQIGLPPETALFVFINRTIPSITATFGDLYRDYKNADNVLYITYTDENVYGGNEELFCNFS